MSELEDSMTVKQYRHKLAKLLETPDVNVLLIEQVKRKIHELEGNYERI